MPQNNTQSQQYNNRPSYSQNHNQNHDGGSAQQSGNAYPTDEQQHQSGAGLSQPFQHDVTCFKCGERG
jgi:hypothetical protein